MATLRERHGAWPRAPGRALAEVGSVGERAPAVTGSGCLTTWSERHSPWSTTESDRTFRVSSQIPY
jgi:hypothetical protein